MSRIDRKSVRLLFFGFLFYWTINTFILMASVWGPGLVYGDVIPQWVNNAAGITLKTTCSVKFILVIALGITASEAFQKDD